MGVVAWLKTPWVQRGLISAALLGAVALWVNPGEVAREVQRLSPMWMALALAISVLQVMLSAWRWKFTADLVGVPLRYGYALREYYLALLVNQLLPGGVLGDAGRAHRHATQSASKGGAWRAVLLERASGQGAVALLVILALCASPLWHRALGPTGFLLLAGGVITMTLGGGAFAFWLSQTRTFELPAWCATFGRDIRRSLLKRGVWYWQLASSLAIVMSYGLVMVCAARAIGIEQSTWSILALTPPLLLAMLVPLSIAGWGLREGTAAAVWLWVGLPSAQGVAISLAYGVLVMLASLPGIWVALGQRGQATPSGGAVGQADVKERVVPAGEGAHTRAQRALQRVDRRHLKTRPARANQQGSHQKMQIANRAGFDEPGNRDATAFDQNATIAQPLQQCHDIRGIELAVRVQGQLALGSTAWAPLAPGADDVQCGRRFALQKTQRRGHASARVDDHAYRVRAAHVAHGELGVIGGGGARAHDHGVRQRPKPVQVNQAFEAIDIVRMTAFGGDAPIQALSQLGQRPCLLPGQRRQAGQKRFGLGGDANAVRAVPPAFAGKHDGDVTSGVVTRGEQPLPGVIDVDNGASRRKAYQTIGVGHDASQGKSTLNHAGATRPTQAYLARITRLPGGLHVSH